MILSITFTYLLCRRHINKVENVHSTSRPFEMVCKSCRTKKVNSFGNIFKSITTIVQEFRTDLIFMLAIFLTVEFKNSAWYIVCSIVNILWCPQRDQIFQVIDVDNYRTWWQHFSLCTTKKNGSENSKINLNFWLLVSSLHDSEKSSSLLFLGSSLWQVLYRYATHKR